MAARQGRDSPGSGHWGREHTGAAPFERSPEDFTIPRWKRERSSTSGAGEAAEAGETGETGETGEVLDDATLRSRLYEIDSARRRIARLLLNWTSVVRPGGWTPRGLDKARRRGGGHGDAHRDTHGGSGGIGEGVGFRTATPRPRATGVVTSTSRPYRTGADGRQIAYPTATTPAAAATSTPCVRVGDDNRGSTGSNGSESDGEAKQHYSICKDVFWVCGCRLLGWVLCAAGLALACNASIGIFGTVERRGSGGSGGSGGHYRFTKKGSLILSLSWLALWEAARSCEALDADSSRAFILSGVWGLAFTFGCYIQS